jgi:hypothetical protein
MVAPHSQGVRVIIFLLMITLEGESTALKISNSSQHLFFWCNKTHTTDLETFLEFISCLQLF